MTSSSLAVQGRSSVWVFKWCRFRIPRVLALVITALALRPIIFPISTAAVVRYMACSNCTSAAFQALILVFMMVMG
ncbi:hypothetical protein A4F85_04815 [Delftia sp. GW456-R20]|nr:hypothetical protein A4F85_04815 [Delftia sp. GW456-R20]